jgi:hypothetical protein
MVGDPTHDWCANRRAPEREAETERHHSSSHGGRAAPDDPTRRFLIPLDRRVYWLRGGPNSASYSVSAAPTHKPTAKIIVAIAVVPLASDIDAIGTTDRMTTLLSVSAVARTTPLS